MRNYNSTNFDDFFNRSIGFDRFFDSFNRNTKALAESYPHYNLKKIDDNKYVIEMAVAGFSYGDLTLEMEGNTLNISGSLAADTEEEVEYFHKGIAERNFKRKFTLADRVEVKDAELVNGILKVYLKGAEEVQKQLIQIRDNLTGESTKAA